MRGLFGSAALGLTLAAVRRVRDVVWIAAGLAVGTVYWTRIATDIGPLPWLGGRRRG